MAENNRVFGLDLFRAVAILMVMISHSRFLNAHLPSLQSLQIFGMFGVELFFVLSGFLIGGILIHTFEKKADMSSLYNFWIRRWFRTLPNYYLFLILNVILFFFLGKEINNVTPYLLFSQNLAWPRPYFYRESWSLCVEEWFYILYPLLVLVFCLNKKQNIKSSFVYAILIFLFLPFIYRYYCAIEQHYSFFQTRMIVLSRLDAMMTGVFVAFLKHYYSAFFQKIRIVAGIFGLAIFLYLTISIANLSESVFGKTLLLNFVSISFACMLPYLDGIRNNEKLFVRDAIEKLSLWSYSLYLFNLPVEFILIGVKDYYHLNSLTNSVFFTIMFWILSIGGAAFIYTFFERPFLKLRDSFTANART